MKIEQLTTRSEVEAFCASNDVEFLSHRQAALHTNVNAWASVLGYKDFEYRVFMTIRPMILHPVNINPDRLFDDHWRIIAHELDHWQRQPKCPPALWWWLIRYGTSQRRRWEVERTAHLVDLKTGRKRSVSILADEMKGFYRLDNIDKSEMVDWFKEALSDGG